MDLHTTDLSYGWQANLPLHRSPASQGPPFPAHSRAQSLQTESCLGSRQTEDRGDVDLDGNTDELVPRRDAAGLLVYAPDLGSVADLRNARLPVFARVDLRLTWRPRGTAGRWAVYAEALNLLNRKNASGLDPRLEYDPASDRPRVVAKPIGSIPLLPTIGVRFRF